jgi:hypothetical protein
MLPGFQQETDFNKKKTNPKSASSDEVALPTPDNTLTPPSVQAKSRLYGQFAQ